MSDTESEASTASGVPATVGTALAWIGFNDEANRDLIMQDAFEDFDDMKKMSMSEIDSLASSFAKRTGAQKIVFGLKRTQKLKSLIHWVQDFHRCGREVKFEGLTRDSFLKALATAAERQTVRKAHAEKADTLSRESSPGKLDSEKNWPIWISALENYLSTLQGADGVPLSYVIREEAEPMDEAEVQEEGLDFMAECVACAPLNGPHFEADKRQVHQIILSFTQGESAADWIKDIKKKADGRQDVIALRAHFSGEGNSSRRLAEAERLRETLHYKSERVFPFEKFLGGIKKMCNIYADEDEEWKDAQKCRFLFQKVQHPELIADVKALKAAYNMDSVNNTFTTIANQLSAAVSELPESTTMKARGVSAAGTGPASNAGAPTSGITTNNGTIWTGYLKHWGSLSKEERSKVFEERKRLGIKPGKKSSGTRGRVRFAEATKKKVSALKASLKKAKRKVAALKKNENEGDGSDESESVAEDAGNQFGGREAKKAAKKRKS